ncbi:IS3 family transposase [Deinococcus peraridilitoris]|uniref:HTH-like domain-containing protein n=1 Tax=Deinococcus peraridilitoris (strain DSM 19664 / LMG 22246 / CIP 109416 / KR-200) TaxID=937777 RepID=L0A8F2_DEIPD|nr:IS3 family transposase [Deinococcus peraridilitoris]AFZ69360.1 hypothetical protein Deipe_3955 [Deinococcus peraridilitoris DSM 19664]
MILPAEKAGISVRRQCQLLKVNRASVHYQKTLKRERTQGINDDQLRQEIEQVILDCSGYGYRRVTHELGRRHRQVNHMRVRRVMKQHQLQCRVRPRKKNTPGLPAAGIPNLLRDEKIVPSGPDQVWIEARPGRPCPGEPLACGLHLRARPDGFRVPGLRTRRVFKEDRGLGFVVTSGRAAGVCCIEDGNQRAGSVAGLIHHSDQGSVYQSGAYLALLD